MDLRIELLLDSHPGAFQVPPCAGSASIAAIFRRVSDNVPVIAHPGGVATLLCYLTGNGNDR
jgi:hypothetical protein